MTLGIGLRTRLTLLVAVVFAAAISITSVVVVDAVERNLVNDTRASAETVLTSYLESIYGGTATVGVVDAATSTQFFYLDPSGELLSEQQYFEILSVGFDSQLPPFDEVGDLIGSGVIVSGPIDGPPVDAGFSRIEIDPDTGELFDPTGELLTFLIGPIPEGEPHSVDLGPDVVGVAQTLSVPGGETVDVGVSSPLQPVTDSLDAIRRFLWFAVPTLVAAVAAITWLAASRALRPVHAITSRARAISAANISERVPVHDANDEINELATTMNDMLTRLEGSQSRQHELIADASHELRSPVAASRAQLEVAAANPDTTDWMATAETVLAEQEHLGRLIDDLLALSRIDEARPGITKEIDVDDLIATEAGRPHPTPVRVSISEPVQISADPALFGRAVRNLIDNASRYANSDVLVTLQRQADHVVIHVDDDGPGIHEDQRERIFDRFTRIEESRDRSSGGAGLGLAIAREVARAHHGDITVGRSPLGGARFSLAIPT